jgi:endonuclease/exonuclease/phosphatase family metal-dependent hydrolase
MRSSAAWLLIGIVFVGTPAGAADVPVGGKLLRLSAAGDPASRVLTFRASPSPAVTAPFGDPTAGASLFVFSSNEPGGCRLDVPLAAGNWSPIGGDPARGWRYVDQAASAGGVKKIVVKAGANGGKITVKARGAALPCDASVVQNTPFEVSLRMGTARYCAAFGGTVTVNQPGRFKAKASAPPLACAGDDVRLASLNVLHGLFCPGGTGNCRLAERIALLGEWIVERKCPDVIALQEVWSINPGSDVLTNVQAQLVNACPQPYEVVFHQTFGFDDSLILSRHPVLASGVQSFYGLGRYALHARIDHPVGPVDVYSTHLASGSDLATAPCGNGTFGACPPECAAASAVNVRDCQAVQLAAFVTATHDVDAPAFVAGDFNETPGSFVYDQMVTGLGAVDTFLAAGNAECDSPTGVGCTSGRNDDDLSDLESPALGVDRRIDFVFMVPPGGASSCTGTLDSPADDDGDGVGTRLFAAAPNPFAPACGPAPDPVCWVSDHNGAEVDAACD